MIYLLRSQLFNWNQLYNVSERLLLTSAQQRNDSKHYGEGEVWIQAKPRVCLHDVHTKIEAGGLKPNSPVTLIADVFDEKRKHFSSYGHFITDDEGNLNLEKMPSIGGSYKGVFPAGLLITLSSTYYEKKSYRLLRRNPRDPWKINVGITNGHMEPTNRQKFLSQVQLERHILAPGTKRIPVRHGKVRGIFFLPPGPGPFPGVIFLFGFMGGIFEFHAALLASRGFGALALAAYDYEDLPKTPEEMHLEYYEEAVDFIISQPKVIQDRCGIMARSNAGPIALYMATHFEPVKAVVGVNASTFPGHTQFYFRGKPYAKGIMVPKELFAQAKDGGYYFDLSSLFNNDFPHMIPVENIDDDTHLLLVCGSDDTVGSGASLMPFRDRMEGNGKSNFETILYENAGHIISTPYDALVPNTYQQIPIDKSFWATVSWGGKPRETCEAQVQLWQKMREFFNRHVRDESLWFQTYLQTAHISSKDE